MARYVALLRGINVGGKNLVAMPELAETFREAGYHDVRTYIQSGNVLFQSTESNLERLTNDIQKALSAEFNYASRVVVVSHKQLKAAVQRAPKGFGTNPAEYRYDVLFLKAPLTADEAMKRCRRAAVDPPIYAARHGLCGKRCARALSCPVDNAS